MKLIATYITEHGGVVLVYEDEVDFGSGKWFDAYWSPNFLYQLQLGQGSAASQDLEKTMEWVRRWDSNIEPIEDLGKFQLYTRKDEDGLAVSLEPKWGCETPILAENVPSGSFLVYDAINFFQFWKGRDAVGTDRCLK